jgi:hypothetical protein
MSVERYRALIDQICAQSNISHPESMYEMADFGVKDANFSLTYGGIGAPDKVLIFCDFGELPDRVREAVLMRLLEVNLYMFDGTQNISFAYNTESKHVVMMSSIPLYSMTGASTLELLSHLADIAEEWRNGYFLNEAEGKSGALASMRGAGGQGERGRFAAQFSRGAPASARSK